jgi:ketopantoate reductase
MIIIGAGRVGTALYARSTSRDLPCTLVSREENWRAVEQPPGEPILLTVRMAQLPQVLERIPAHRKDDLVFIQNGAIRDWLSNKSLGGCTRGILFFAVPTIGAPIQSGGLNPFTGPQANRMTHWFSSLDLETQSMDWGRFSAYELEKLIWLSAFGLLSERYDLTVGEVLEQQADSLEALVEELRQVGRAAMAVDLPLDYLMKRLGAYTQSIPTWSASVKEWSWRNGWFDKTALRFRVKTPLHRELLVAIGKEDKLSPR